jgi:hypothetical protein
MHDYGVRVRLMDVESGKEVTEVAAKLDSTGKITGVERHLFGIWGDGLKLKANRRYRLVGEYENPTGEPLSRVMAHMVGLFVPDDMSEWPRIDPRDPGYQRDLTSLHVTGEEAAHWAQR